MSSPELAAADSRRSQMSKGVIEMALLMILRQRPHYGLELLEKLNINAGLAVADGTIYPLLHRLARQRFVRAEWRTQTPSGRPRKYYALTAQGQQVLEEMTADWHRIVRGVDRLGQADE